MAFFSKITKSVENPGKKNAVVMGRRTWESIPAKFRPLPERLNIILSRSSKLDTLPPDVVSCQGWEEAMDVLQVQHKAGQMEKVWIIGGRSIYESAMESPFCHRIYFTRILAHFDCDVFFPSIDSSKFRTIRDPQVPEEEIEENGIQYRFEVYERL